MSSDMDIDQARAIILGEQVEGFINGPVGQYILAKAEERAHEATARFATADLTDLSALQEMQRNVALYTAIQGFLQDALNDAQAAEDGQPT